MSVLCHTTISNLAKAFWNILSSSAAFTGRLLPPPPLRLSDSSVGDTSCVVTDGTYYARWANGRRQLGQPGFLSSVEGPLLLPGSQPQNNPPPRNLSHSHSCKLWGEQWLQLPPGRTLHTASPSHQGSDQSPHHLGLVGGLKDAPRSKVTPLCSLIQFQGDHQDSSPQSLPRGQQEQLVPTGVTT